MPLYNHVYYQQNQGKNPSSVQQKPQSFSWGLLKVGHQDRSSPKWFQSAMPYSKALAELCISTEIPSFALAHQIIFDVGKYIFRLQEQFNNQMWPQLKSLFELPKTGASVDNKQNIKNAMIKYNSFILIHATIND